MIIGIRRFISVAAVVCALAATTAVSGDRIAGASARNLRPANPQVAAALMEVRIRRLHLVRPDLIPYPIAYEIIC
jgi:hypothetical protein